jgi:hypothetical protein
MSITYAPLNNRPLSQRVTKLLRVIAERSAYAGDLVTIDAQYDYPLADAIRSEEFFFLLEQLRERGDIEWPLLREPERQIHSQNRLPLARLTLQGWERLQNSSAEDVVRRMTSEYDAFICHAAEDKTDVAQPLAERLQQLGYKVWYDRFVLQLGDSLRRKIDEGLARSRFGIVILSSGFFAKEWPQRELDGLVAREIGGIKVILPVWHRIDHSGVAAQSPTLADRVAARTEDGLDNVILKITEALGPPHGPAPPLAQ